MNDSSVPRSFKATFNFFKMVLIHRHDQLFLSYSFILFFFSVLCTSYAQQSAAGQDTLIGIVGRDFIMMGADSSSSGGGGIALTSSSVDKLEVVHDGGHVVLSGKTPESDIIDDAHHYNMSRESMKQQAIVVGFAGDLADADRLMGTLKTHAQVKEYEAGIGNDITCVFDGQNIITESTKTIIGPVSSAGLDAEGIANLSRNEISSRMRSRQPLQLCLLVGGMVRCNSNTNAHLSEANTIERVQKQISAGTATYKSKIGIDTNNDEPKPIADRPAIQTIASNPFLTPKLFWLDQYGSIQNMRYAAHGHGSNFAYSILDQRYRNGMSREESVALIRECFDQLRQRYVINSPKPPLIKCIDRFGIVEIVNKESNK